MRKSFATATIRILLSQKSAEAFQRGSFFWTQLPSTSQKKKKKKQTQQTCASTGFWLPQGAKAAAPALDVTLHYLDQSSNSNLRGTLQLSVVFEVFHPIKRHAQVWGWGSGAVAQNFSVNKKILSRRLHTWVVLLNYNRSALLHVWDHQENTSGWPNMYVGTSMLSRLSNVGKCKQMSKCWLQKTKSKFQTNSVH